MPYPTDWSIILVVLLKNREIGSLLEMDFCPRCRLNISLRGRRLKGKGKGVLLAEYILIASDRQVVNDIIG